MTTDILSVARFSWARVHSQCKKESLYTCDTTRPLFGFRWSTFEHQLKWLNLFWHSLASVDLAPQNKHIKYKYSWLIKMQFDFVPLHVTKNRHSATLCLTLWSTSLKLHTNNETCWHCVPYHKFASKCSSLKQNFPVGKNTWRLHKHFTQHHSIEKSCDFFPLCMCSPYNILPIQEFNIALCCS